MRNPDRGPLPGTPVTRMISQRCNNRLGAVYSALHSFWMSRQNVLGGVARRDAYSTIFFDSTATISQENDFSSSPDELLALALRHLPGRGTDFMSALTSAQAVMERCWSTERCDFLSCSPFRRSHAARTPVIIFLSDGEFRVEGLDQKVQDLARTAVRLGYPKCLSVAILYLIFHYRKALSLQAISFGRNSKSWTLRRMAQIVLEIQRTAPPGAVAPTDTNVLSAYSVALDTVSKPAKFLLMTVPGEFGCLHTTGATC
jgi:hypothetical protein